MTEMQERLRELIAVNRAIASTLDYDEVLGVVVEKAMKIARADSCILLLVGPDNVARIAAARGLDERAARDFAAPLDERIHQSLEQLVPVGDQDSFLGVPVIGQEGVRGLLAVFGRALREPDHEQEFLLEALADQAAIALTHASQYRELESVTVHKSRLLETIQSNTDTYLSYLDRDLRFVEANPAYLEALGRHVDEVVGRPYAELIPDTVLQASIDEARQTGRPVHVRERECVASAGRAGGAVYLDWSAQPICDQSGAVEGIVISAIDVTEKVLARRELELASQRKTEFLAMLAHELRNPLAAVASATEVLRLQVPESSPVLSRARDAAKRQVAHMTRLLDDLLDVARIARGKVDLRLERVDLLSAVTQAVESTGPLAKAAEQQLSVELPKERLLVQGDFARLVQIFSNLLTNAVRYTPRGGHIRIRLRLAGDEEVETTISDDGYGIEPEELSRVFDLFLQGPRSPDSEPSGGLGIGLTVVKQLTEMHGGRVEARSDGVGRGSEFTVRLPILAIGPEIEPAPELPAPGAGPARKILLVEDNPDAADMLSTLLEMEGHSLTVVSDGESAIHAALRENPDVILLDIGLPHMDGYEVARRLRHRLPESSRPLVIALSGYGRAEDRRGAAEAGIDHYLIKPVDTEALRALLKECCASSEHEQHAPGP